MHFLSPRPQKTKNIHPEKNSFYFGKWNFLTLRLKNFLYFRKWNLALFLPKLKNKKTHPQKGLLYFRKQKPWKSSYIFAKESFFLYFRKRKPRKNSLYFKKRNFQKFQERFIQNQNPGLFRTGSIFRTLTFLELEVYSEPWCTWIDRSQKAL